MLLGSWRWAVVTAAALLALPMWTGHVMFNVKDIPVATGYTITTLALVAMVSSTPGSRLLRIAALVTGVTLMVGTRPAMTSAVLVAAVLLVCGALAARSHGGVRPAVGEAATGVAVAAALLAAVYPHVFAHPTLLVQSVRQSASFRDNDGAGYLYVPFQPSVAFEPDRHPTGSGRAGPEDGSVRGDLAGSRAVGEREPLPDLARCPAGPPGG